MQSLGGEGHGFLANPPPPLPRKGELEEGGTAVLNEGHANTKVTHSLTAADIDWTKHDRTPGSQDSTPCPDS